MIFNVYRVRLESQFFVRFRNPFCLSDIRDGPLIIIITIIIIITYGELGGGGWAGEVQKNKIFAQGKLKAIEKKFMHPN